MTRILASLLLGATAIAAHATVLTFDISGIGNGTGLDPNYGDNVTALTMGGFSYGGAGGFTPDVTVDYTGLASPTELNLWTTGYNDLVNVVEYEPEGTAGYLITFTAAAGKAVTLSSFDLGNWGGAVTLPAITITDENSAVVYSQTNIAVPASNTPGHLSFAPSVTGSILTLRVDTTGLGGESDNMGLDNIQFSQTNAVPEPATLAALSLGLAALVRRRRK